MRWAWVLIFAVFPAVYAASPVETARAVVEGWLEGEYQVSPRDLTGLPADKALEQLVRMLRFPPPPKGLEVNLEEPLVEERGSEVWVRFPAALGEKTREVIVRLRGGEPVAIFWRPTVGLIPAWVYSWWFSLAFLFGGFTLTLSLFFGRLRRVWVAFLWVVKRRRGLFILTHLLLYGAFALGAGIAYLEPKLARVIQDVFVGAVSATGIEEAAKRGPLALAAAIFYWNLTRGLLLTTALPAMLFGLPALIFNLARYLVMGVALSPAVVPWERFLWHLPVVVLELGAYNLAVFGGLVILSEVLAGGRYRLGLRLFSLTLVPAVVLLFWAALYEAFEVLS